jgi:hypothetical protein
MLSASMMPSMSTHKQERNWVLPPPTVNGFESQYLEYTDGLEAGPKRSTS